MRQPAEVSPHPHSVPPRACPVWCRWCYFEAAGLLRARYFGRRPGGEAKCVCHKAIDSVHVMNTQNCKSLNICPPGDLNPHVLSNCGF